jgi:hypothetical protein
VSGEGVDSLRYRAVKGFGGEGHHSGVGGDTLCLSLVEGEGVFTGGREV